jgi:hypothetical protein
MLTNARVYMAIFTMSLTDLGVVCASIPLSNRIEARYGDKVAIIGAGSNV